MRKLRVNQLKGRSSWMIVDNFAGGGGASTGIELALGRSPDVAINHDPEALAMHEANHPHTRHYPTDVFEIDPRVVVRGRRVGLAWFSPDCTHHSKARGGKPIREAGKKSRALAWIVVKWAEQVRPRVIILENVEEFEQWGPTVPKLDETGKPVRDEAGNPLHIPDPLQAGKTFQKWVRSLKRLGYQVEWKQLRACDYGAPTIRKRLFVIARCDNKPIVWPKPSHGKPDSPGVTSGKLDPWRTAAEIIDWSLPCPSIFLSPEEAKKIGVIRPLKPNTMKRIAAGLDRYVIKAKRPFIVVANHGGDWFRGQGVDQPAHTITASRDALGLITPYMTVGQHGGANRDALSPVQTLTASVGDQNAIVAPYLVSPAHSTTTGRGKNHWSPEEALPTITAGSVDKYVTAPLLQAYHGPHGESHSRAAELSEPLRTADTQNRHSVISPVLTRDFGNSAGVPVDGPAPTVMPGGQGKTGLVQAFLAQHNTGVVGHPATVPLSTITGRGTQQQIVEASFLSHQYTSNTGGGAGDLDHPLKTVTAGGGHHAAVKAFLQAYYGSGSQGQLADSPLRTASTRDRMGIVTIDEVDYQIVDIGMRMLTARELFLAQGFPDNYKIDVIAANRQGKKRMLPKDAQVRMCGNSVCPDVARALVAANCGFLKVDRATRPSVRQLELAGV